MAKNKNRARESSSSVRSRSTDYGWMLNEQQPKARNKRSLSIFKSLWNSDRTLIIIVGILVMAGMLFVYSASNAISREYFGGSYHFFMMQAIWCCLGLAVMTFTALFSYQKYQRFAWVLLVISGVLLLLVYVPGLGAKRGGGTRWIRVAGLSFQPVELAKLAIVIYIAQFLSQRVDYVRDFRHGIFPSLLILAVFFALIYKQPDFGSVIIIALVVFAMLFVGGARVYQMGIVALAGVLLVFIEIWREPYRLKRWLAFLNPWEYSDGAGYQIIQSFYALGSGGILGTGLGVGMQKQLYLPAPHTDFIFAVIGEELGFIGSLFIISLFMVVVWRGMRISLHTQDRFGSLLAFGLAFLIGIQAVINIGVVTGSLPTKGLTLPFISSGGSSMLVSLASIGILLNISRQRSRRGSAVRRTRASIFL